MSKAPQSWTRRQEIPDPQVREAADQFESARQLLCAQPPFSGLLYPQMNVAAVAIELYLKCLSADKVHTDAGVGWVKVSARPMRGHGLTSLLDKVESGLRHDLDCRFRSQHPDLGLSFRDALEQCDGVFQKSRYPFEPNTDVSHVPLGLLMVSSQFLKQFVAKVQTRETIQFDH